VDESVKVSKVGVMYEVGSRMVIICERVLLVRAPDSIEPIPERGHTGSESIGIVPEGSLMSKMEKVVIFLSYAKRGHNGSEIEA